MTEKKKTDGLHIDKKTIISITAILLAVYILAGALTRILPRGEYNMFLDEERESLRLLRKVSISPLRIIQCPCGRL